MEYKNMCQNLHSSKQKLNFIFERLSSEIPLEVTLCSFGTAPVSYTHLDVYKRQILGNRMRCLICRRCGAVLFQWVAEPHRFPPIR